MGTTPTAFTGTSKFSSDLQSAIQRAISIANLPIQLLQQQQQHLNDQVSALNSLETKLTAVSTAITGIGNASGAGVLAASSSDQNVAKATISGNPLPGSYTIQVTNIGAQSTSLSGSSLPKVTDPTTQGLTSATSLTLTVDGQTTTIQPADTTLNGLASAINQANAGVQASIVNLGSSSTPDYRLYLRSTSYGPVNIALTDGTNSLADPSTTGSAVVYNINGVPAGGISSNSRSITLAPGLTVNLLAAGTTDIAVSGSSTSLSNALSAFVTAYNAAVDEVNTHRGKAGGALAGASVINSVTGVLQNLAGYNSSATTGIASLTDLGVTLGSSGKLTVDSTVIAGMSDAQLQNATAFLGSAQSGGFLKAANDALKGLDDTTDGVIQASINSTTAGVQREQTQIDEANKRLTQLQNSLMAQMAAADALIASMEQKATFFTSYYQAQNSLNNVGF